MKKKVLIILLIALSISYAQNTAYQQLVNTEFAFVDRAADYGIRDSFLSFIAEDGILFRPHPVNGKKYLEASKSRSGYLAWYPAYAYISRSDDMGFTTGPWSFKKDKKEKEEIAFGQFVTIWARQKDGGFKYAIDFGISHDKHKTILQPLYKGKKINAEGVYDYKLGNKEILKSVEKSFSENFKKAAYSKYLFDNSRLLVEGLYPMKGKKEISDFLTKRKYYELYSKMEDGKISKAGDLGYTYGVLTAKSKLEKKKSEFYYMRVWYHDANGWKLLSDTWNPKE